MNPLNDQQLFQYFKKQIQIEGAKDIELVQKKFELLRNEKTKSIQETLIAKYEIKSEMIRSELKHEHEQSIRKLETTIQSNFGKNRISNLEKLFSTVLIKIQEFTASDSYFEIIHQWIKLIPNFTENIVSSISIRPIDVSLKNKLSQVYKQAKFIDDSTIKLGGIYLKTHVNTMRYDLSLDSQWKLVKESYFEKDIGHE